MIVLTKINDDPIAVNCDLIEYIEETPDTIITMTNGDKVVVRESMAEIVRRIVQYRRLLSESIQAEGERQLRGV
jgi:flagellar protein FlbD